MKFNRVMVFSAALVAGLLLFSGCQKVVEVTDETTTVVEEAANNAEETVDLDDILVIDVPEETAGATTGDESFSGATTGAELQFDSATTGGDSEAIDIEVIEEETESASTAAPLPTAFFFNI